MMTNIRNSEYFLDGIMALACAAQFHAGHGVMDTIKAQKSHDNVDMWPTHFSGVDVIVNRATPRHRDSGGAPQHFDALVSAGTHEEAHLDVPDVGLQLKYNPKTVIIICGRILSHRVQMWKGGERICFAHYMKDTVHERYGMERPEWPLLKDYQDLYSSRYRTRQGLDC